MITLIDARGCFLLSINVVTQLSSYQKIAFFPKDLVRTQLRDNINRQQKAPPGITLAASPLKIDKDVNGFFMRDRLRKTY